MMIGVVMQLTWKPFTPWGPMLPAGPIAPCWKQTLSCDLIRVQQKNNLDINDVFFLQYKNGLHGYMDMMVMWGMIHYAVQCVIVVC